MMVHILYRELTLLCTELAARVGAGTSPISIDVTIVQQGAPFKFMLQEPFLLSKSFAAPTGCASATLWKTKLFVNMAEGLMKRIQYPESRSDEDTNPVQGQGQPVLQGWEVRCGICHYTFGTQALAHLLQTAQKHGWRSVLRE